MNVVGFYPLWNMRKSEITKLKEQFASKGFRYVATARSVDNLKLILQEQDIKVIAIKDFHANWSPLDKLRLVMTVGSRKWYHVETEDIRLLDEIREELMWEQQMK